MAKPGDSIGGVQTILSWVFNEKCIARQKDIMGNELPVNKLFDYAQGKDVIAFLLNGTVIIYFHI